MDTIHQRFPQYDEAGQALIDKAYAIASAALADETRGNGHPFIEHRNVIAETLLQIGEYFFIGGLLPTKHSP